MKRWFEPAIALGLTLAALGASLAQAQALGPEGRAYAVETREGRYTAQLQRNGRY